MEEKLNSFLPCEEIVDNINDFLIEFSQLKIFHSVSVKWGNSFSLRINYVLNKDKEKTYSVEILIESSGVQSIITIKNEHNLVIQYFIMEFQKIL